MAAELHSILLSARTNDAPASVTGALLYNSGNFAQVLEGPVAAVERIFEKNPAGSPPQRSHDCTERSGAGSAVSGFVDGLSGGGSANPGPLETAAFDAAFGHSVGAGEQILAVLRELVAQEDDWVLIAAALGKV